MGSDSLSDPRPFGVPGHHGLNVAGLEGLSVEGGKYVLGCVTYHLGLALSPMAEELQVFFTEPQNPILAALALLHVKLASHEV